MVGLSGGLPAAEEESELMYNRFLSLLPMLPEPNIWDAPP